MQGSERPSTYAHRNGETEPPTADDFIGTGQYWFNGSVKSPEYGIYKIADIVECYLRHVYNDNTGETLLKSEHTGQWWGPIVPPWELPTT